MFIYHISYHVIVLYDDIWLWPMIMPHLDGASMRGVVLPHFAIYYIHLAHPLYIRISQHGALQKQRLRLLPSEFKSVSQRQPLEEAGRRHRGGLERSSLALRSFE